jgi:hypothetical protein
MLVHNRGEALAKLFTYLKLGLAAVVLFFLVHKLIDLWQANEAQSQVQPAAAQQRLQPK